MSAPAIEVAQISKKFRLYRNRPSSIKAKLLSSRAKADDFWALRDISFDIAEGESLGLIGHNGSGKTTLLKVIAGILRPTSGTVSQRGRIAALLELGAGFHPELTGRENVYLNASFLGLTRKETDKVFDDIVEFAELQEFMDNQVKFYSSGMLVRLGFAVAVHVDPAILLIDEVLAVGDEAFQRRCLDRVRTFQREGRTIVLVTHALDTVRQICDRAVMLDHGNLHAIGSPNEVVYELRYVLLRRDPNFVPEEGTREVEIAGVDLIRDDGSMDRAVRPGEDLTIEVEMKANEPVSDLDVSFAVLDGDNRVVIDGHTKNEGIEIAPFEGKKRARFILHPAPPEEGKYWVTVGLEGRDSGKRYHVQTQRWWFETQRAERDLERAPIELRVEIEDL